MQHMEFVVEALNCCFLLLLLCYRMWGLVSFTAETILLAAVVNVNVAIVLVVL